MNFTRRGFLGILAGIGALFTGRRTEESAPTGVTTGTFAKAPPYIACDYAYTVTLGNRFGENAPPAPGNLHFVSRGPTSAKWWPDHVRRWRLAGQEPPPYKMRPRYEQAHDAWSRLGRFTAALENKRAARALGCDCECHVSNRTSRKYGGFAVQHEIPCCAAM